MKKSIWKFLKSFGKADVDIYFSQDFSFNKDYIPVMPSTRLIHILNQFKISNNLIILLKMSTNFLEDDNRFNKWTY